MGRSESNANEKRIIGTVQEYDPQDLDEVNAKKRRSLVVAYVESSRSMLATTVHNNGIKPRCG